MAVLARSESRPGVRTKVLEGAVLKTLVYSDLFDFPLTAGELSTYLFDVGASESDVVEAARQCPDVVERDGHFCLRGRQHLVAERQRRYAENGKLWLKARRYGSMVAAIPFVRMVAVTGSLAPGNSRPGDDIDLLLVVAPGRLWLSRLLVLALVRAVRLIGDELCPNFLLSEGRLQIDGSAFPAYYARELSQMTPLFGADTYRALRLTNGWTVQLLPNSNHVLRAKVANWPHGIAGLVKRAAEAVLALRIFDAFEALERRRKVARLLARHTRESGIVEFSDDRCRGHFGAYVERMMAVYEIRCGAIMHNSRDA